MTTKKTPFKLGDSVRFKDGQQDEMSGIDISGWQGRITEINEKRNMLLVALDSITLKSLPREYLEASEKEGLGWPEYYIEFHNVESAQSRDTKQVVTKTIAELSASLGWVYLEEEGRDINAILAGASSEYAQMTAWAMHMRKVLRFPFYAEISEWQRPGSDLQVGQKVKVIGIADLDEWVGVLVKVRKDRQRYICRWSADAQFSRQFRCRFPLANTPDKQDRLFRPEVTTFKNRLAVQTEDFVNLVSSCIFEQSHKDCRS